MKKLFKKIDGYITNFEEFVIIAGVLGSTFLITANVVMRYVFNASFFFAEEFARYIAIWVTFFGASACIRHNVHVKIEVLLTKLPFKAVKILVCFTFALCISGCIFLFLTGIDLVVRLAASGQMNTAVTWLPMWIPNVCIPIFGVLATKNYTHLLILNLLRRNEIVYTIGGQ